MLIDEEAAVRDHECKALLVQAMIEYKLIPQFAPNIEVPHAYHLAARSILDDEGEKSKRNPQNRMNCLTWLAEAQDIITIEQRRNLYVKIAQYIGIPSKLLMGQHHFSLRSQTAFFIAKQRYFKATSASNR